MSKRAFTYSRYSHLDSTDVSIEGQMASQEKYAGKANIEIVQCFADHAISGASILNRPSLTRLLQTIETSTVDIILVDHLDRLTRDDGDMAYIHKLLVFNRIELHSVAHGGKVDRNTASIMAIVGRNQLESTAHAVRRGQELRIKAGKNAGSRPYGYKLTSTPGELVIDETADSGIGEADIVRRIYRERISGMTPRSIAGRLNAEDIPSPNGGRWNASTINGSKSRAIGILRNPIYIGKRHWNRVSMIRNPATGKRISRANKAEEVVTADVPDLAIIDAGIFNKVQAMFPQNENDHPSKYRRAKTIFSGLLRCGRCGGGMSMKDKNAGRIRIQCSTMKESRSCSNTSAFYLDEIVESTLGGLTEKLAKPAAMEALIKAYNLERSRLTSDTHEKLKIFDRQIGELLETKKKTWADYDSGIFDGRIANERLLKIDEELKCLESKKNELPKLPDVVAIHPATISKFRRHIEELSKTYALKIDENNREAAEAIRKLVHKITITPTDKGTDIHIEGLLGLLIDASTFNNDLGGLMVAGEGLEPPTRGL